METTTQPNLEVFKVRVVFKDNREECTVTSDSIEAISKAVDSFRRPNGERIGDSPYFAVIKGAGLNPSLFICEVPKCVTMTLIPVVAE